MKKLISVLIVVLMTAALFAGCSGNTDKPADPTAAPATDAPATEVPATEVPATEVPATDAPVETEAPTEEPAADNIVNLMDMYTVTDPEGLEYDTRRVFYSETPEDDFFYGSGLRHSFNVIYGKDDKAVYMYSVSVFETEEQAAAYVEEEESGTVDGNCVISVTDTSFFEMMASMIPDLQGWIDNLITSGMTEIG